MKKIILLTLLISSFNILIAQESSFTNNKNNLELIDEVPAKQKKRKIMSLLITSCKYGIYQISDKQLTEDRFSILKKNLKENLPQNKQYDSIQIKNFTIHINSSRSLKGIVSGAGNDGLIADVMINDEKVGCSNDDLFGSYNLKEVPKEFINKNISPLIIVIDFKINEKFYHTRTVSFTEKTLKAKKKFPEFTNFISEAIRNNCLDLTKQIQN